MKGWRVLKDGIQLDKSNMLYYMFHGIKCTCGQLPRFFKDCIAELHVVDYDPDG